MISDQQESGTTHEGCNLVFHGEKDDNMRIMISLRCNSLNKDEAEVQQSVVAGSETRGRLSAGVLVAAVGGLG